MGSTLLARHAGMTVAANATAANNAGTARNVATSVVVTPNNRLAMTRVRSDRAYQSGEDADQRQLHPLADDESENIFAPRTQGDENADVVGALRDQIRHDAVEPTAASSKANAANAPSMVLEKRWRASESCRAVLHGPNSIDDNGGIDRVDFADDGRGESRIIGGGASDQEHAPVQLLLQRESMSRFCRRYRGHIV